VGKLSYYFTPAAMISNFAPLIVILHDKQEEITMFEYKMWNILQVDSSTVQDETLLKELIDDIADEYETQEHIYMYKEEKKDLESIKKVLDRLEKMMP